MTIQHIQNLLSKHLPELEAQAQPLFSAVAVNNRLPNVVVYGVYNSGKSSLLNSLTGHVEPEYFATRDIPETHTNKSLEHQGLNFIDTPGLDVNKQDTATANAGAFQADIILFVHRLSSGPVQQADLVAMQNLAKTQPDTSNIILVLTEAEVADENLSLIDNITEQVQQAISPKVKLYLVSNPMFIKGVSADRQILIKNSGIPTLLHDLIEQGKQASLTLEQTRQQKIACYKSSLLQQIKIKKANLEMRTKNNHNKKDDYERLFVNSVQALKSALT